MAQAQLAPRYVDNYTGLNPNLKITNNQDGFTSFDESDQYGSGTIKNNSVFFASSPTGSGNSLNPYAFKGGQAYKVDLSGYDPYNQYVQSGQAINNYKTTGITDQAWINDYKNKDNIRLDETGGKFYSPAYEAMLRQKQQESEQALLSGLGAYLVNQNVLGNYNSFGERAGFNTLGDKTIGYNDLQSFLAQPSQEAPLDPNNPFVQRSQGILPPQQFSNGQFTGTPPPLPNQAEIDARDKMNNQMYGTPLQGASPQGMPTLPTMQAGNQPTGADFAKYFGQGGAGYNLMNQGTPPTSPVSGGSMGSPTNPTGASTGTSMGATTPPANPNIPGSDLEQQIASLLRPSIEETNAQNDINSLISSRDFGLEAIRNRQVPMRFVAGEQDALARQAALKIQPLQQRLAILQAQRQSALDASKFSLERQDRQSELARQEIKETKAEVQKLQLEAKKNQEEAQKFAVDNNITSPFYTIDGQTIIRTVDQKAYSTPEQFFADGGARDFGNVQRVAKKSDSDLKSYPASYQEYLLAKKEGYKGTYNDYQTMDANRKAVRNTTIINQQNEGSKLGTVLSSLNASKGSDGYVDPNVYLEQRSSLVGKGVKASDFDDSYASYLNPKDRARLGVGKATGVDAVPGSNRDL